MQNAIQPSFNFFRIASYYQLTVGDNRCSNKWLISGQSRNWRTNAHSPASTSSLCLLQCIWI